jgi:tetratricopeptide (TPR) repeat protein
MIQNNLGRIYQGKKEYDLAIQHFEDSIRMNDEAFEEKEKIYAYGRLIEIYLELKDWSRIEFYLAESIQMAKKYELIHCYIKLRSVKALTFKLRGDEMKYEKEMKKIIDLSLKKEQFILLVKLANELGEHFYAKRAYKKASDYFKLAQEYHKVLQGINKVACPPVNAYVVN